MLNWIGQDPHGVLEQARVGIVDEMRRSVDEFDRELGHMKRDILRGLGHEAALNLAEGDCLWWFSEGKEYNYDDGIDFDSYGLDIDHSNQTCAIFAGADGLENWDRFFEDVLAASMQPMNLGKAEARAEVDAMLSGLSGPGLNLQAPQWEFNLDKERAESEASTMAMESAQLADEFEQVMRSYEQDRSLVDHYYMEYEFGPLFERQQQLAESHFRTVVTYIVDNT